MAAEKRLLQKAHRVNFASKYITDERHFLAMTKRKHQKNYYIIPKQTKKDLKMQCYH